MKHLWNKNRHYRAWVHQRDRALEQLHKRAQLETADVMREMLTQVLLIAKAQYRGMHDGIPSVVDWFEAGVRHQFSLSAEKLIKIVMELRTRAYTLARASESEIIAQLSPGVSTKASVDKAKLHQVRHRASVAGETLLQHRITLYLDRLRRKITSYAQAAALSAKSDVEFAQDVYVAFPKHRTVNVPRRTLKPIREADYTIGKGKNKADIAVDNIDEEAWDDMRDAYMNEYVPKTRAPEFVIDQPEVTGEKEWYAWEFERDITNEFVQSVRDGQIDAANENGITDFVVISIIDDKTCESCCGDFGCVDFDGMLTSEVEDETSGEYSSPPYHFNCRCTLAPATDNIPDKPDDGAKDFEEWLNS